MTSIKGRRCIEAIAYRRLGALLLALSGATACGTDAGVPYSASLHKVQARPAAARALVAEGATVLADYGSYQLLGVDDALLASRGELGVELAADLEVRDEYNLVLLNAKTIDTTSPEATMQQAAGVDLLPGKRLHLVQFQGPIQPAWFEAMVESGVRVVSYIPHNAYLVYGDAAALEKLTMRRMKAMQWSGRFLDEYKLDPSVATAKTDTFAIQLVQDEAANAATLALIESMATSEPVVQEALGYLNVVVKLDAAAAQESLALAAAQPEVVSIQPRPEPQKVCERQDMILAGALTANVPNGPGYLAWLASKGFTQAQFTDSSFGVDVSDSGIDDGTQAPNHFGLYVGGDIAGQSRVLYNRIEGTPHAGGTASGCDGHGNLNAHIVGGYADQAAAPFVDAQGYRFGLGIAPFVRLGSSVIFDPDSFTSPDYEDLQSRAYRDGMRISTNSWGSSSNTYGTDAQRYDALVRDAQPESAAIPTAGNQEMVIVFAAGNGGPGANTTGNPGNGKNVFTVGASENVQAFGGADGCAVGDTEANLANDVASFSSRGPTADGRVKPDIMAPGTHVSGGVAQDAAQATNPPANPNGTALSCFDAGGVCGGTGSNFFPSTQQWYTASSGTSHSTPAIAGGAALLRQHFLNTVGAPPSPAMTKAYLMGSTRYMDGTGANDNLYSNNQGMGRLDLGIAFDGTPRLLEDQAEASLFTATGQTRVFEGFVADPTKPFRVTLAWTDAPGATSGAAYNNNLDLTVTVGSNTYRGNVFTGATSVTGGTADTRNNVESVFLPAGLEGAFTVTVAATNINSDGVPGNAAALDQDFALVVYNSCTDAGPIPTGITATLNGDNRIDIDWTANGSASYSIYRSFTAGGPYVRVANVTAPPYADEGVSGGTTYYYVVRARECAESAPSSEVSATATGLCLLPPTFAGVTSATSADASTCATTVTWSAATPICGGSLSYSVYRSTTPGFTPGIANRIVTGITGTSFSDDLNLANNGTYYYVVRAIETSNAVNEDTNVVTLPVVVHGAASPGVFFDDFDGNRPPNASAYWVPTTVSGTAGTLNLTDGCHYQSATHAYRFGAAGAACGGTYPTSTVARLILGGDNSAGINGFHIPASAASQQMTFRLWYNLENTYDGAYLEYSTAGASGPWTHVNDAVTATAPYISAGGYDGTVGSVRAWTNTNQGANGSLKAVTVLLDAVKGQTIWLAFRFSSDSSVNREGLYLDDVRLPTVTYASCSTNTPPPGPAVSYAFVGLGPSVVAGAPATFTVNAVDAVGQVAMGYTGTATFTSSDTRATLPADVTFTAGTASGVVATFGSAGPQSLTAIDGVDNAVRGSGSFTVTPGAPTQLTFKTQPATTVAGAAMAPFQVALADSYGNPVGAGTDTITVELSTNPGAGTLTGTTSVAAVAGVATFGTLKIDKVGEGYTFRATSGTYTEAQSGTFDITPAAPAKLVFAQQPTDANAGDALSPAVQVSVLDAFDNLTSVSTTVTLTLSTNPGTAVLAGDTSVETVNGVATFSDLWLNKVGSGYTLHATAGSLTAIDSDAFAIAPAAPHHLFITAQPGDVIAGDAITPAIAVTVYDRFENVATQVGVPVTLALVANPGLSTLSGTATVTSTNGIATFADLSLNRAGVGYAFLALSRGLFGDISAAFDVKDGAPHHLAFTVAPADTTAGAAITPAVLVTAYDRLGNVAVSTPTDITMAIGTNPASGTLAGTVTASTTTTGVAAFADLAIDKAAPGYVLAATAGGMSASSPTFTIRPGPVASLVFSAQPTSTTAGAVLTPAVTLTLKDALDNTVTGATDAITVDIDTNPGSGTLAGTTTVAAVAGVATFADLAIAEPGVGYTLSASGAGFSVTSDAFDITVGAAARFTFQTPPADTVAGTVFGPIVVEIRDAGGNPTASTADVTLTLGGVDGATLGGTTTVAAVGGVATFGDLFIDLAALDYTLTASATNIADLTSASFDVAPAAAAGLVVTLQPGAVQAGVAMAPAVRVVIVDALGNVVTSSTDPVTVALAANPASGTLAGTLTVAATAGVALFPDLTLDRAGTGYTLAVSAGALAPAETAAFAVVAGPPARLAFTAAPTSATAGVALAPVAVELQDALGNRSPVPAGVSIGIGNNPSGALLFGTQSAAAADGVASFADLAIRRVGVGYTLIASSAGLASATTTAFDVTPAPAATLLVSLPPSVTAGEPVTFGATAYDTFGNLATAYGGTLVATSSDAAAALPAETAASAGAVADLPVTFKTRGLQSLTVTDVSQAELHGTAQTNVTPFPQPTVAIMAPATGTIVSGIVSVTASGQVATGATVVELSILVDGAVVAVGTDVTLTADWDSAAAAAGTHTISAVITDSAGNVAVSAPVGVVVEGSAPPKIDQPDGGCDCRATDSSAGAAALMLLAALLCYRRRATQHR